MLSSARRAWPSLQSSSSSAGLRQFEKYFSSTFARSPVSYKKRHKGETLVPCAADIPAWCHGAGQQTKLDHSGTSRGGLGQQRLGAAPKRERTRSLDLLCHPLLQQLDHSWQTAEPNLTSTLGLGFRTRSSHRV